MELFHWFLWYTGEEISKLSRFSDIKGKPLQLKAPDKRHCSYCQIVFNNVSTKD